MANLTTSLQVLFTSGSSQTVILVLTNLTNTQCGRVIGSTNGKIIDNTDGVMGVSPTFSSYSITLVNGDTISGNSDRNNAIQYQIFDSNNVDITPVATTDSSLANIKATAQSAVGVQLNNLTAVQVRSLMVVLLYKAGGVNADGTVKKLSAWAS